MGKRNHEEEPEKDGSERWLLTYSDLITLLLALFIILYAMSAVDSDKFKSVSNSFRDQFNVLNSAGAGQSGVLPNTSNEVGVNDELTTKENKDPNSKPSQVVEHEETPKPSASGNPITTPTQVPTATPGSSGNNSANADKNQATDAIYKEMMTFVSENHLEDKIEIQNSASELKIKLKDTVLFRPDSSKMTKGSKNILDVIEGSLNNVYDKIDHITISGHTADPNNSGKKSSDFGWELSVNRAVEVLKYLKDQGLPEYKMSVEGYSHFQPANENDDQNGLAMNRRVEITIKK